MAGGVVTAARLLAVLLGGLCTAGMPLPPTESLVQQRADYESDSAKTILELQPFRTQTHASLRSADGSRGDAALINLNPDSHTWYLLALREPGQASTAYYHLQSAGPLRLLADDPGTVRVAEVHGSACILWSRRGGNALEVARHSGLPYAPLCADGLYLRNPVAGHHTSLEQVTDFLRTHVWGGEQIISLAKQTLYQDRFLEHPGAGTAQSVGPPSPAALAPLAAAVAPEHQRDGIDPQHLEIDLAAGRGPLLPGQWYATSGLPGIFVSVIAPEHIRRDLLMGHERSVNPLDAVESRALVYLVGFDLQQLDLHFVLGTDHPRLDWSPRAQRIAALPGPDGVASAAPLIVNGMVSPADVNRTVATFAGGFKRSHGAFRFGALAARNHGSHYGFIEQGVIFSKLQPGLATVVVLDDGSVDVRTWTTADDLLLPHVRSARQNGVPLIEYDPLLHRGVPGDLVNLWGPGNWSGSANVDLRTLRAGACLQESGSRRFLIFGYFSAATPSAMARVFQAYQCRYALHLDMNALEHTYLALYVHKDGQRLVEHLIRGMSAVDRSSGGEFVPRFLGFPDDRDFFYFTLRRVAP